MEIVVIGVGVCMLFVIQYIANRLVAITPERLTKAAIKIAACNEVFGRQLLEINRHGSNTWAETVDYLPVLTSWQSAVSKILKSYNYLLHAKENTDYRLPLLLIGSPLVVDGVTIPDKFIFRITDSMIKEISRVTVVDESTVLKSMAEQLSPNSPLSVRFWEFRVFLLGSGRGLITQQVKQQGHEKFALLAALHLAFGKNSRSRLLRSRWNTPRIVLETLVYAAFQFAIYYLLFSPKMSHREHTVLAAGYKIEFGFLELVLFSMGFVALATIWFLIRFRRYAHSRKFHTVIATFIKSGVISRDDLRAYGQLVLGLKPDDGFIWLRE